MKVFRKHSLAVAMIVWVILLSAMAPADYSVKAANQAEDADQPIKFSFDNGVSKGWETWNQDVNLSGVADPKNAKNKCVKLLRNTGQEGASAIYYNFSQPYPKGVVVMEAGFMVEGDDLTCEILGLSTMSGTDNNIINFKNGRITLRNSSQSIPLEKNNWFTLKVTYNTQNKYLELEVDGKKYKGSTYVGDALTRIKIALNGAPGKQGALYVDDISFSYVGSGNVALQNMSAPEKAAVLQQKMNGAVALYLGSSLAYAKNARTKVDPNHPEIGPVSINGRILVPVNFIAENFGLKAGWDGATSTITIEYQNQTITMQAGSRTMKKNGAEISLDAPIQTFNDRIFIPLGAIEALGKKVFRDDRGLIVISDKENILDENTDAVFIDELIDMLVFERPAAAAIIADLKKRNPRQSHPRLIFTPQRLRDIKSKLDSDPNLKKWYANLKKETDRLMSQPDKTETWQMMKRTIPLAGMYLLSGDGRYAEKAWKGMEEQAKRPDWNPNNFLITAEWAQAFAITYDWLYDYLKDDQKAIIRKALSNNALKPALEAYLGTASGPWGRAGWVDATHNWNQVCNNGVILAALAIADEEEALAGAVLEQALKSAEKPLPFYGPDGGWDEGPGYWLYATQTLVRFLASLDSAVGSTYGLSNSAALAKTGYFAAYMSGPTGVFNFGDSDAGGLLNAPEMLWLAQKYHDPRLAALRLAMIDEGNLDTGIDDIMYYDYSASYTQTNASLPLDRYFRFVEAGSLRSGWKDPNALFVGFHAGHGSANHAHLDAGNFVLDALGERWAEDLGKDNYSLNGYFDSKDNGIRWKYYRTRAEGQNTLVINPKDTPEQIASAFTAIEKFESKDKGAMAILDLTPAYAKNVREVKRGFMLTDNRSNVVIQDEIKGAKQTDVWWFMHTRADIQVPRNGKIAVLEQKGKRMAVRILAPADAVFTVMDAKPLSVSPNPSKQNPNNGIRKLAINLKNIKDTTIAVAFVPLMPGESAPVKYPAVVPLSNWKIPDGEIKVPILQSVFIDNKPVEGFTPGKFYYTVVLPKDTNEKAIPEIAAAGANGVKVTVKRPEKLPGAALIEVSDPALPGQSSRYVIYFSIYTEPGTVRIPGGVAELKVEKVTASQNDGNVEANTVDRDLTTRWSAAGDNEWIQYDLGSEKRVTHVSIVFYSGTTRITVFDVEVSNDGTQWKKVFSGKSSGKTNDPELYSLKEEAARYVRIVGHGNTTNKWNSITEVGIYGKEN